LYATQGVFNALKNLVRLAGSIHGLQHTAPTIIVEKRFGQLSIRSESLTNDVRLVVLTTAAHQAIKQGIFVYGQLDYSIERSTARREQGIKSLSLLKGPWKAVEQKTATAVRRLEPLADNLNDQLVWNQVARLEKMFGLESRFGAILGRISKYLAR
jgi:hypothetical protein